LTAEEYARLPEEDGVRHELAAGLLMSEPIPLPRHGPIELRLGRLLADFADEAGLGVVLTEAGFLLSRDPDTVRGPDVAFVRRDRFDPDEAARSYFRGAPDLAVEIHSRSNRSAEMHAKVADYLAAGASLVWVVDPERRSVTVCRSLLDRRRLETSDALDGGEVLLGLTIPLAGLFGP
jgi:Uma2 family endonuclease